MQNCKLFSNFVITTSRLSYNTSGKYWQTRTFSSIVTHCDYTIITNVKNISQKKNFAKNLGSCNNAKRTKTDSIWSNKERRKKVNDNGDKITSDCSSRIHQRIIRCLISEFHFSFQYGTHTNTNTHICLGSLSCWQRPSVELPEWKLTFSLEFMLRFIRFSSQTTNSSLNLV